MVCGVLRKLLCILRQRDFQQRRLGTDLDRGEDVRQIDHNHTLRDKLVRGPSARQECPESLLGSEQAGNTARRNFPQARSGHEHLQSSCSFKGIEHAAKRPARNLKAHKAKFARRSRGLSRRRRAGRLGRGNPAHSGSRIGHQRPRRQPTIGYRPRSSPGVPGMPGLAAAFAMRILTIPRFLVTSHSSPPCLVEFPGWQTYNVGGRQLIQVVDRSGSPATPPRASPENLSSSPQRAFLSLFRTDCARGERWRPVATESQLDCTYVSFKPICK